MSLDLNMIDLLAREHVEPVRLNDMSVRVLRWPSDSRSREYCKTMSIPRLLLLEGSVSAPVCHDELEDWVRPPISREDLKARTATLRVRALSRVAPVVDGDEMLRFAGHWLALSPVEARLMHALAESYRGVVPRKALVAQGWPGSENGSQPRRNALDLHILRLRRRLGPIRLAIRTVWGRGYLLEPDTTMPPVEIAQWAGGTK